MKYEVELKIEQHWYPVIAPSDSKSAAQAVAQAARMEGLYRARLADTSGAGYELFSVPSWGQPVALGQPA